MKIVKRILIVAVVIGVAAVFVKSAFADDVQPPWWRGELGTTSQYWEFTNSPVPLTGDPIQPDGSPLGGNSWLPSTHVNVYPDGSWISIDTFGSDREGIWPLSGAMSVTVDNYNTPNDVKYMWVQLTWHDEASKPATGPILSGFDPAGVNFSQVAPVDLGFGWYETTFKWEIYPNPTDESFLIGGNILVDEMVIDTWCVPEPSTIVLGGLGAGMFLAA